jgi:hypothetical protein
VADLDDFAWDLPRDGDDAYGVLRSPGAVQHRTQIAPVRARRFRLSSSVLTAAEAATLATVFTDARGSSGTTSFTPPGGSAITVAFVSDQMPEVRESGNAYSTEFEVEEVL